MNVWKLDSVSVNRAAVGMMPFLLPLEAICPAKVDQRLIL